MLIYTSVIGSHIQESREISPRGKRLASVNTDEDVLYIYSLCGLSGFCFRAEFFLCFNGGQSHSRVNDQRTNP